MEVKHGVLLYHMFHSSVHKKKKKKNVWSPFDYTLHVVNCTAGERQASSTLTSVSQCKHVICIACVMMMMMMMIRLLLPVLNPQHTHTHTKKKASLVVNTDYQEDQLHRKDKKMIFFITCLEIKGSDTHLRFLWA